MTKYLKYLISLFLAFGLMVNDGTLYSQSNSVDYYQFSNLILAREWNYSRSKTYVFNQINASEKIAFLFHLAFFQFQDIYNLQTPVILKLRTQLYQKISAFTTQYLFLNEISTSKNYYKNSVYSLEISF